MNETEQHQNEAHSYQALFPSNKITLEGYCVIKVGDTLPVDQCRRVIVFDTKLECEQYQSRVTGIPTRILGIGDFVGMAEDEIVDALGLHIPDIDGESACSIDTELLNQLLADRPGAGIKTKCGDIAALFEVATELGVMFAGLPVDPDTVEGDMSWRRPKFGDAGEVCDFAPQFWSSPNPQFVFEGVYIPAPGNYTVGEWSYVSDQCPQAAEGGAEAVNAPDDPKPIAENNDEAEEAESDAESGDEDKDEDEDDDEDGDDEDYDEEEPSEMERLTLDEIQSEETFGDDLPFSSSLEEDIEVQAVCRLTPRTSTMMTILEGLGLASKC